MNTIHIAVDIMGGDFAPAAIVEGVGEALDLFGDKYHLHLVGDPKPIETELRRIGKWGDKRLELVPASQVVDMGEHPVSAVRRKRDASINVAMNLVRQKKAAAVFSAGNTGAAVAAAYFKWSMIPGIERPGIATVFPTEKGHFLLLDAGATVDCTPLNLLHYAVMGSIYSQTILHHKNPRVGLLCNGTEEGKGNKLTQAALISFPAPSTSSSAMASSATSCSKAANRSQSPSATWSNNRSCKSCAGKSAPSWPKALSWN